MSILTDTARFHLSRAPRPMLSRDADSMYWMSRYIERAEHIARLLLINSNLLIDVGDLAPHLQDRQWQSVLRILHAPDLLADNQPIAARIRAYMTSDPDNPNSIVSCLTRARENARGIRETISAEMWESINALYWMIRSDDFAQQFEESPNDFWQRIMHGSMLFQGLTDQTLAHDQRWMFTQLAKYLERIDVTARILETKFAILQSEDSLLETPIRNIHWMAVLRSCCSIEAYRRNHIGDTDPLHMAAFLILETNFPRSIRFGVGQAHAAIAAIRAEVNPRGIDPAERILGRLDAQLEYAEVSEILAEGLLTYLQRIQARVSEAAMALQKTYFLH